MIYAPHSTPTLRSDRSSDISELHVTPAGFRIKSSPTSTLEAGGSTKRVENSATFGNSRSEDLFDARVHLKILLSQYTMHLNNEGRNRFFSEIDRLLSLDDWIEDEKLPLESSFRDLVRWSIFSGEFLWTSLGLSLDGHFLAAWKHGDSILTTNFSGNGAVRWSVRLNSEEGLSYIAGESPLIAFHSQWKFYENEMRAASVDAES